MKYQVFLVDTGLIYCVKFYDNQFGRGVVLFIRDGWFTINRDNRVGKSEIFFLSDDVFVAYNAKKLYCLGWAISQEFVLCMIYPSVEVKCTLGTSK